MLHPIRRELAFYKRWCLILSFTLAATVFLAVEMHKVDPMCRGVEAKYQQIIKQEGPDAVIDSYPNPAEDND